MKERIHLVFTRNWFRALEPSIRVESLTLGSAFVALCSRFVDH